MNKEILEDRWTEAKEYIREKFSNLTEEDIRQINGRYDQLIARLQQRYGFTKDQAEAEIRKWAPDFESKKIYRETPYYQQPLRNDTKRNMKEHDNSSLLKWLLLAGLPLLFLLGYFANQVNKMDEQNRILPNATEELIIIETPADQSLSQNVRRSLSMGNTNPQLLDAIKITSSNGTVTASGIVQTTAERDAIIKMIQNTPGVTHVNNKLIIK